MFTMGASHTLEATHVEFFSDEDEPEVDLGNILNSYIVPTTPNTRIHKDHLITNVIGDVKSSIQTRRMTKTTSEQGFLSVVYEQKTHDTLNTCGSNARRTLPILTPTEVTMVGATQDRKSTTRGCQFLGTRLISWQCKKQTVVATSTTELTMWLLLKSTTGGCQFLGNRLISWQCKKQTVVATSTTKAEYVASASCCGKILWIQNQLLDYGSSYKRHVKRGRDTKIPQSSGPPVKVGDEAVYKELGDRIERAATTASNLDAEQDSGNIK
ncbi:hypothetical protein Tco_1356128 [Tanacetum coccineum]